MFCCLVLFAISWCLLDFNAVGVGYGWCGGACFGVVALVMIWLVFCIWLACDWCFDGGDLVVVVLLLFSGIVLCFLVALWWVLVWWWVAGWCLAFDLVGLWWLVWVFVCWLHV